MVRSDHGPEAANAVARRMVVAAHRDGGQAQFVERPLPRATGQGLAATRAWMEERLAEPTTVEQMARHAGYSPRSFARRFHAETGTTPLQWLIGPPRRGGAAAARGHRSARRGRRRPRRLRQRGRAASTSRAWWGRRRPHTGARSAQHDVRASNQRGPAYTAAAVAFASAVLTLYWTLGGTLLLDKLGGAFEDLAVSAHSALWRWVRSSSSSR